MQISLSKLSAKLVVTTVLMMSRLLLHKAEAEAEAEAEQQRQRPKRAVDVVEAELELEVAEAWAEEGVVDAAEVEVVVEKKV